MGRYIIVFIYLIINIFQESNTQNISTHNLTENQNYSIIKNSSENIVVEQKNSFWQLTDIHLDPTYSPIGNKYKMCHEDDSKTSFFNGYIGHGICDSSTPLFHSAIKAMTNIEKQPDFILWTGDNVFHNWNRRIATTYQILKYITKHLLNTFGNSVPIIPCLGNHDSLNGSYPENDVMFYQNYLQKAGWNDLIVSNERIDFLKGGYFSRIVRSGVMVLSLNTNLYCKFNTLSTKSEDPAGQFKWLRQKLESARRDNRKVIISAHVAPGFMEQYTTSSFFRSDYNDKYLAIISEFGDLIMAHVYAHQHTDSLRLLSNENGENTSVGFIAPPLSPMWYYGPSFVTPSLRLYFYNESFISDYAQYRLNLTEANIKSMKVRSCQLYKSTITNKKCGIEIAKLWKLFYRATTLFGIESLSPPDVHSLYLRLDSDKETFDKYYAINSASYVHFPCNNACKRQQLCAIKNLFIEDFNQCIKPTDRTRKKPFNKSILKSKPKSNEAYGATTTIIIVFSIITISVIIIITILICKDRNNSDQDQPLYPTEIMNRVQGYAKLQTEYDDFFDRD